MEYREIVSVTGMGGLFQLIATKSDGAIVKNLADQSTKFISARLHNVTPLESIEIYTTGNNVRLHEVLERMKGSSEKMPDAKNAGNDEIKGYFKVIFPELDEDRVYVSDMKKMLKWFGILGANDLLNFDIYNKPETEEAATEEITEDKSARKASRKKAEEPEAEEEVKEKPAKKTTAKKAAKKTEKAEEPTDAAKEKPAKKAAAKKAARKKAE